MSGYHLGTQNAASISGGKKRRSRKTHKKHYRKRNTRKSRYSKKHTRSKYNKRNQRKHTSKKYKKHRGGANDPNMSIEELREEKERISGIIEVIKDIWGLPCICEEFFILHVIKEGLNDEEQIKKLLYETNGREFVLHDEEDDEEDE